MEVATEAGGTRASIFVLVDRVRLSRLTAWGLALIAFLVALTTRFAFDHLLPAGFPYLTFFPAVILTTFFAGVLPGAVCAIACGLAAWYWFIPPTGTFAINFSVLVALGFYAFVVGIDIVLIRVMHHAVDRLEKERVRTRDLVAQLEVLLAAQKDRERQQQVLRHELSHRMKNTLAMVQAVVSQSLRNVSDTRVAAELASARIMALSRAQDALTATDWSAADVGTVVGTAIEAHHDGSGRFVVSGPPVELDAQRSLGLALAIHELATNATKYGALSNETGVVTITWNLVGTDRFAFRWAEAGGPLVLTPSRQGFGTRLTERVVPGYFAGSASIDFAPAGVVYDLAGLLSPAQAAPV